MATVEVTFRVDTTKLFDMLRAMNGKTDLVGARILGVMICGEHSFQETLGLGIYGIEVKSIEKVKV